ncbi:FAD-binding and (Fe-S)-binding domain-containing protein [Salinisphaera sp. Q1T1-3]|uniref:FAD-binding and (Fe-S)-binding domain-containing protein n=1 Tax=Salinisphaera sp. Q1T1-3 TaxID=2321229 RepID=UPI001314E0B1|nr:FAD-binding and (Fe-S)-binding domain-containing protein [Salinisphaera sp. Q1T1-3]
MRETKSHVLPRLSRAAAIAPEVRRWLTRLRETGFAGDIDTRYATRLTLATDNSAFQQLPAAAVFPADEADLLRVGELLADPDFAAVHIAPRGGGTSTIGCALTTGVVVDCSRHMNHILAIDAEAREAVVEPGVVLDQLNAALLPLGLFFAPNVAPSSRATLGGMLNTDGCGKGSRVHGKTSDHVLATHLVLADGQLHVVDARSDAPPAAPATRAIERRVAAIVEAHRDEIARVFPGLSRYLSGYNLAQAIDADGRCRLNKLIGGSEGTLALVSQLRLRLTPLPTTRRLFALRYDDFDSALRDAQQLVTFDPVAIESIDETVMGLARDNPIYERVRDYIENTDGSTPGAVNLVEFSGHTEPPAGVAALTEALRQGHSRANGFYLADQKHAIDALWDLRKAGVGLLGATPGRRKPLPFVEDTVVDPRVLADYVRDFRAILDEYGVSYGMFGHIDVGCLHVRPALDLTDPADERRMREITDRVARLANDYGGLLWNEHGKGYRSAYNRAFFGERLYGALADIKAAFDPRNQLNPGKIVALDEARFPLAAMDAPTRGTYDRQIPEAERAAFPGVLACNGNGACFDYDPTHVMCPSYRATRDRLHSPKGRAGAMREWLRLLSQANTQVADIDEPPGGLIWQALSGNGETAHDCDDFSHEVWQAMDGCLSCRACATQCPIRVDVPRFKSVFLNAYHSRYARPRGDYALAFLENGARLGARWPGLVNRLLDNPSIRSRLSRALGLTDLPCLSVPTLADYLADRPHLRYTPESWAVMTQAARDRTVFLIQDAFTSFFDTPTVTAVIELIEALGYRPQVVPFTASGKPRQVKGFLSAFRRTARRTLQRLRPIAALGRPLLVIEPSIAATMQVDYRDALGECLPVTRLEDWLAAALAGSKRHAGASAGRFRLMNHCTARTAAAGSDRAWQTVFDHLGFTLMIGDAGCCGMSGVYGHETRHRATSERIFDLSWADVLDEPQAETVVVPGYSCRSQISRLRGRLAPHPARVLLDGLQAEENTSLPGRPTTNS